MIMSSSRASQSSETFPRTTPEPKRILFVGGEGGMGRLYRSIAERSNHDVFSIDKSNWYELDNIAESLDLASVTVPIKVTPAVIRRLDATLKPATARAHVTSTKREPR